MEKRNLFPEELTNLLSRELVLPEARIAEEKFDWIGAAELYSSALRNSTPDVNGKNGLRFRMKLYKKIIYDYIRASFQSKNLEQFQGQVELAIRFCKEANAETLSAQDKGISTYFFEAKALELRSWLDETPSSRTDLLKQSIHFVKLGLEAVRKAEIPKEDLLDYYLLLLQCHEELWVSETKPKELDWIISGALERGQEAVHVFQTFEPDKREDLCSLARIYCLLAWFCGLGALRFKSREGREDLQNSREIYWNKFDQLAEKAKDLVLLSESYIYRQEDYDTRIVSERAKAILPKIVACSDNQLVGGLLSQFFTLALPLNSEQWANPDSIKEAEKEMLQYFDATISRYAPIKPVGIFWENLGYCYEMVSWWYMIYATRLSSTSDTIDRRIELLDKAVQYATTGYETLNEYSHRAAIHGAAALAWALCYRARLLPDLESKRNLLIRASKLSKMAVASEGDVEPYREWDYGYVMSADGRVQFEQALFEQDKDKKISLIKSSIETYSNALNQMSLGYVHPRDPNAELEEPSTYFLEEIHEMWRTLYELTGDETVLAERLEILEQIRTKDYASAKSEVEKSPDRLSKDKITSPDLILETPALVYSIEAPDTGRPIVDYLVKSFIDDYVVGKSTPDESGWRSLPQVIYKGKIRFFSVYAKRGGVSAELHELTRKGIIENKIIRGTRGRGGEALRIRIAYNNYSVRSFVSKKIKDRDQRMIE